ncbi:MAG: Wzz/FepE/Etk N-terminal domain-containing protein [Chloroflexota bacterium]
MSDFIELRNLIGAFRRMWWLIVGIVACAGLLGYLYSINQSPVYSASTTLIIGQPMRSPDLNRNQIQTSQELGLTYADIARRFPVLDGTVQALGLDMDWRTLRGQITVGLVRNTQLLEITVTALSPLVAEAIANEVANQLILFSPSNVTDQRNAETQEFVEERLANLQQKIQNGERRLKQLTDLDFSELSAEQILGAEEEEEALEKLITDWEANYSALLSSAQIPTNSASYLEVIEPAMASFTPIRPRTMLNTWVALVVGAILAVGLTLFLDHIDDSVHSGEDLRRAVDLPLLGQIVHLSGRNRNGILQSKRDIYSRTAEDYRLLRSRMLLPNQHKRDAKTFLLASPGHGEGSSTTITNLGLVMAQAGLQTIIVDADLRYPKQHELLGLSNERGLTNLLCFPEMNVAGLLKRCPQAPNLQLLSAGILWEDQVFAGGTLFLTPTELLGTEKMKAVLGQLHERADVILIDGPPIVPYADTSVLSIWVDSVVLVTSLKRTKHAEVQQALLNLQQANADVIGVVARSANRLHFRSRNIFQIPQLARKTIRNDSSSPAAIEAKT